MERTEALPRRDRLFASKGFRSLAGNAGWVVGDRVVRMGIGVVIGVWMARHLGSAGFGAFNFAKAFVALFAAFASLGLDKLLVQELIREPENRAVLLGTATAMRLVSATLAGALAILVAFGLNRGGPGNLLLVVLFSLALVPESFWTLDLWNSSQLRARDSFIAQTAAFALITLFRVALLLSGAGVVAFVWCVVAERAAGAAGLVVRYAKSGERLRAWAVSSLRARALLRQGWPLMMNLVMVTIYMKSDAIMLGALLGDSAVGIYSAAAQISEFWYFLPAAIVSSATPALLQARSTGQAHYRQRILLLLEVLSIMSVVVALTLSFFSGPVVTLLFGQEYTAAGPVLAVHAWTSVFVLHGQARTTWLIAEGYQRLGVVTTSLGAIVNIALNAILIPREGPVGAAIATLCAQFIAAAGGNALFAETRGFAMLQIRSLLPTQIWKQLRHREGSADDR